MISAHQALAARRLLMLVAALAATLGAHAAAGGLAVVPAAPVAWGALAAIAVLRPPRAGAAWRERGAGAVLWRLVALQAALHAAMTAAPWAFGLAVHHRPALIAPAAVAAHAAAAVALALLIARAERLLSLAQGVARALKRALSPRRHAARGSTSVPMAPARAPRPPQARRRRARGPPWAGRLHAPVIPIHGGHPCAFAAPSSPWPRPA